MKDTVKKRQLRTRSKIKGTTSRPRLSVFRSNKYIFAQIIDDDKGKTLIAVSEIELGKELKANKTEKAKSLGLLLAKKTLALKIKLVVFDRGSYLYHGRVKALAEGAREGGLQF